MPGPWITSASLLQYAADVLHVPVANLPPEWADFSVNAAQLGYDNVVAYLAGLGYSAAQLSQPPDQGADWNLTQGLYELAGMGGGFATYERAWFDRFDLVKQWKEGTRMCVPLYAGVPTGPDGTSAIGGVAHGCVQAAEHGLNRGWRNRYYEW